MKPVGRIFLAVTLLTVFCEYTNAGSSHPQPAGPPRVAQMPAVVIPADHALLGLACLSGAGMMTLLRRHRR